MTQAERNIAAALVGCSFLPGCWDKRFAKAMAHYATHQPDEPLSDRQGAHMLRLAHRYRRQMPTRVLELALDEMERRANERRDRGEPALPDFTPARRAPKRKPKPEAAEAEGDLFLSTRTRDGEGG